MKLKFFFVLFFCIQLSFAQKADNLRIAHMINDTIEIYEFSNNKEKLIYQSTQTDYFPVSSKGDYIFCNSPGLSIYNLKTKHIIELSESAPNYLIGGFYKNSDIVYYLTWDETGVDGAKIILYDFLKNKTVKSLSGFSPQLSNTGDALFYMKQETVSSKNEVKYLRKIYRYSLESDTDSILTTIELNDYYRYDVTEIKAATEQDYVYRIYDEHEYRYYYKNGVSELKYYPEKADKKDTPKHKEQFDLCFSQNNDYSAFTERDWNKNTYLVVVDLKKQQRTQTEIYCSFPKIINNQVYFVSDPNFINSKNPDFEQIKDYALFVYDIISKSHNLIKDFKGEIFIMKN